MQGVNDTLINISNEASGAIQSGILQAFEGLGEIIASDNATEAFSNMLISLMDLLKQFGSALVAAGLAKIAFDKLMVNPYLAIAAGGALIVTAAAAKSALQKASTAMASGGIVYGETFARIGEYPGAASNPEVIAPLDKLRDLIGKRESDLSGDVVFRIEGDTLVGVLGNYGRRQKRIR
jgi:hypothetical protein